MCDLIDKEAACWRADLASTLFGEIMANTIILLPIVSGADEDYLMWQHDHMGVYTLRSGYSLLQQPKYQEVETLEKVWKTIWGTKENKDHRLTIIQELSTFKVRTCPETHPGGSDVSVMYNRGRDRNACAFQVPKSNGSVAQKGASVRSSCCSKPTNTLVLVH